MMQKHRKLETVKNLIRHRSADGEYIFDLTEGKYYHEVDGATTEITEEAFRVATANDTEIIFNLIDAQ